MLLPGPVDQVKIVLGQHLPPPSHLAGHMSEVLQPPQGAVVSSDGEMSPQQVVAKLEHKNHYSQQLPPGHAVTLLDGRQLLRAIAEHPLPSVLYLGQHAPDPNVAGIRVQDKRNPVHRKGQDRGLGQSTP